MKVLYVDVETTGLEPIVHGIIQLAYIVEIDGKVKKRGSLKINPLTYSKKVRISSKALEVNGYIVEDFNKFKDSKTACNEFIEILKKYVDMSDKEDKFKLVAYNAKFDTGFLIEWFKDSGRPQAYPLLIDYRYLDPFELFKYLVFVGKLQHNYKSFSLEYACKTMGLEFDAHDAVADIEATRDLHIHLMEVLNG